ncbi:MAG: type II secretion system minor pseudopilin GspK [Nitrospirota bacterium]
MIVLRQEDGVALLITLLIAVLLVVLIVEFDFNTRIELKTAGNFRDEQKAYYIARSGISAAIALLKEDREQHDYLGEFWSLPLPPYPLGDGYVTVNIIDENRKINVNHLVKPNRKDINPVVEGQIIRLFQLLDIEEGEEIVDAIIDWIDRDSEPGDYGAEDDYYNSLETPYDSKNNELSTISELRLIKGITDKIFNEISPYLTVYGNGMVNINTSDSIILQSFSDNITEEMAENIIGGRPFIRAVDVDKIPGMQDIARDLRRNKVYDVRSSHFLIRSDGIVNNTKKIIKGVVTKNGGIIEWRVE